MAIIISNSAAIMFDSLNRVSSISDQYSSSWIQSNGSKHLDIRSDSI